MTREEIQRAAEEFADREYEIGKEDHDALHKGFYWGAKWAHEHQWVSVEDATPPEGELVFVAGAGFIPTTAFHTQGGVFKTCIKDKIQYWMEIPKIPQ